MEEKNNKQDKVEVKKQNFVVSTITLVLGVLLLASGQASIGVLLIFGSLAYMSRKKQNSKPSKGLLFLEIISLVFVLLEIVSGINSGSWYEKPVSFVLIPILIIIAYLTVLLKKYNFKILVEKNKKSV